jgi:hypothetical protein
MAYKNKDIEQKVIEEITSLHNDIKNLMEKTLQNAIQIGSMLVSVKEKIQHGSFIDWIENNLPFTVRTAQRYMTIFYKKEELKASGVTLLSEAYKWLTLSKTDTVSVLKSDNVSLLADLKSARHALLPEDVQITEIDESKELTELYAKIDELDNQKSELEDELQRKLNEISRLQQDLNDEVRLKRDKKAIIEAMEKLTDHTLDKEKLERDFSDLTETLKEINASKNFFRKHTLKLQAMDLNDVSIKALSEDVKNLLDIIGNWGVVVAKKFNIKMK